MKMQRLMIILSVMPGLAACGTPESRCNDGVQEVQSRLERAVDSEAYRGSEDLVAQARMQVAIARAQGKDGEYGGCLENLDSARALMNRAQRTN